MELDERVRTLEEQLTAALARLEQVEQHMRRSGAIQDQLPSPRLSGFADQLQARLAEQVERGVLPDATAGLVAYAGAVRAPEGELVWDFERNAAELLAVDVEPIAQLLAALGHTARLDLVRLLLHGPQTSQQLQEAVGVSSGGPLYHHLKALMAVGLVSQPSRNLYQISPQRIIPFLTILAASLDARGG